MQLLNPSTRLHDAVSLDTRANEQYEIESAVQIMERASCNMANPHQRNHRSHDASWCADNHPLRFHDLTRKRSHGLRADQAISRTEAAYAVS